MMKLFDVAGSAMSAQMVRLNTVSSNLSNADSVSNSEASTYRARSPVFRAVLNNDSEMAFGDSASYKVEVLGIVESKKPAVAQYQPNHPMANEDGYIFTPNVNVVEEMANMMSASRSYQTAVEFLNTARMIAQRTLQLGQA